MTLHYHKILTALSISIMGILPAQYIISDAQATPETVKLFNNLGKNLDKGYFVGHQDDLAYGVYWKEQEERSDVKDLVKDYPAVYGWEIGDLELGKEVNLDGVPFDKMKEYIKSGHRRGGIITISWHLANPITGGNSWDYSNKSIASVLPGGAHHSTFEGYMAKAADFLEDLKDDHGNLIPIIWRPFHEHTGGWFWWGINSSTDEDYKSLFRYSVDYLREKRGLHNLIIGYNTGTEFNNADEYLKRYPGDEYVDMVSFDTYQRGPVSGSEDFAKNLDFWMKNLDQVAKERKKIPAVGEIGYNQIPHHQWFTKVLAPVFNKYQFSYVLFWRNAGYKQKEQEVEYYLPYKGHPAGNDFMKFYKDKKTLFEKEARKLNMYK